MIPFLCMCLFSCTFFFPSLVQDRPLEVIEVVERLKGSGKQCNCPRNDENILLRWLYQCKGKGSKARERETPFLVADIQAVLDAFGRSNG